MRSLGQCAVSPHLRLEEGRCGTRRGLAGPPLQSTFLHHDLVFLDLRMCLLFRAQWRSVPRTGGPRPRHRGTRWPAGGASGAKPRKSGGSTARPRCGVLLAALKILTGKTPRRRRPPNTSEPPNQEPLACIPPGGPEPRDQVGIRSHLRPSRPHRPLLPALNARRHGTLEAANSRTGALSSTPTTDHPPASPHGIAYPLLGAVRSVVPTEDLATRQIRLARIPPSAASPAPEPPILERIRTTVAFPAVEPRRPGRTCYRHGWRRKPGARGEAKGPRERLGGMY